MKKYNSVQFQVIAIANNVIATSNITGIGEPTDQENMISAPDRRGNREYDLYE